jgi:uncharacterized membrane protein YbjE (DUF340 family)
LKGVAVDRKGVICVFWFVVGFIAGGLITGFVMTWIMNSEAQISYDQGWMDGRAVGRSEVKGG